MKSIYAFLSALPLPAVTNVRAHNWHSKPFQATPEEKCFEDTQRIVILQLRVLYF